jgi:hypothetical protein
MFESILEETMRILRAKGRLVDETESRMTGTINQLITEKEELMEKMRAYENRITAKDIEIKTTKNCEGLLKREVAHLREILRFESKQRSEATPTIPESIVSSTPKGIDKEEAKELAILESHIRSEELKDANKEDEQLREDM